MGAERETLERGSKEATYLREQSAKLFWEREMMAQKRIDSAERMIQKLNNVVNRLAMNGTDEEAKSIPEIELLPHSLSVDAMTNLSLNGFVKVNPLTYYLTILWLESCVSCVMNFLFSPLYHR